MQLKSNIITENECVNKRYPFVIGSNLTSTVQCAITEQDAQLSQRDRAAGCVIVFAKSRTLELGDNHLRTL